METTYFLKVINRDLALVLEHEGRSFGEPSDDGSIQAHFPLVGFRILLSDGTVQNHEHESWQHEPVTINPITLATL